MTDFEEETKPDLLELAHYGVKGMKWGVRKDKVSSSDIVDARQRFAKKQIDYAGQRRTVRRSSGAKKVAESQKLADMKVSLLKDPDRATAMRMTRGEKGVYVAFAALALPAAPGIGAGAATRVAVRKNVEKKQRTGAYDR